MSEEDTGSGDQPPAKKIVVKKTVVRKPRSTGAAGAPRRPVVEPKTPPSEGVARAAARAAAARAAQRPGTAQPARGPRPTVGTAGPGGADAAAHAQAPAEPPSEAATALRSRFSDADAAEVPRPPKARRNRLAGVSSVGRGVARPFRAVGRRLAEWVQMVVDWFILFEWPRLSPPSAAAVGGLVAGGLGAAAGYGFMVLFSATLGTPSGGGRYGSLALVGVGVVALLGGRTVLRRQGVRQSGMTSFLGIVLTLILVLIFFLDLSRSAWGWLLLPALMAGSFAAAQALLAAAGDEPEIETRDDEALSHDVR